MPNYTLPPAGAHFITLAEAIRMTGLYRQSREIILAPEYRNSDILCNNETFALADLLSLVNRPGCAGFRIYYGMKENKKVHAILVGTNNSGHDLLPEVMARPAQNDTNDWILEDGQRCPPLCPPASPLNP